MQEDRQFIQDSIEFMEEFVEKNTDYPDKLFLVSQELFFRTTRRSRALHKKIVARLEELLRHQEPFAWPETNAVPGLGGLGDGVFTHRHGLLSYLGYRVGENGEFEDSRRSILEIVFKEKIPNVNSHAYMDEWGIPESSKRLRKLAETIAALVRNARRRDEVAMSLAIREWEGDLAYLRSKFYDGRFNFQWPPTLAA